MTQHVDPAAEASEIIGALTGLLGGAATLITVLRRHPEAISKETQAKLDDLQARLDRVVSEEELRGGKQRRPNGATTGC